MLLRNSFFAWLSRSNVKRQFLSVFLAALLPVAVIGGIILASSEATIRQQYENLVSSDNQRVKSILYNTTTHFYNISEDLASDTELSDILETTYNSTIYANAACSQYDGFQRVLRTETSVSCISVYTFNSTIGVFHNFQQATDDVRGTSWFRKASDHVSPFWQVGKRSDSVGNVYYEATLYRHIPLVKTGSYAVLAISMSNNFLRNQIENNTLCSALSVNGDPVFYSTWPELTAGALPVQFDAAHPRKVTGNAAVDGRQCLYVASTLLPYHTENDTFYIASFDSSAVAELQTYLNTSRLMLEFIIVVSCLILFLFTHYFSARLECLHNAMHRASNNDYRIVDDFHGNDELADTFRDLQALVEQVKATETKIYSEQLREQKLLNRQQEMEYNLLANQINPHFLYNTLETIRMKALTEGNRGVATAIKLLGKSMRYVLENTGTSSTTLQKELDYIDTYLKIQKLRFGDRVNYTLEVAPEIDPARCEILPLLLQPVVENAISHGLEGVSANGQIHLDVRLLGSSVLSLTVSDNGMGMTQAQLASLRKHIRVPGQTKPDGVGLYNINQRILLCYGECYGIAIESGEGRGTQVNLTIPYHVT